MKKLLLSVALTLASSFACADSSTGFQQQFFYGGLISGYGDVDWSSVIDIDGSAPPNPSSVTGNQGVLFGADFGYQINPHFAVEGEYVRLPTSELSAILFHPATSSTMNFTALVIKVIAPLSTTPFSLFADAGPAYQYQANTTQNLGTFAPTFGGGLLYRAAQHWQMEASFQYAPGTGKSIGDPMTAYVPEIYMGTLKLDYIFQ